MKKELKWLSLFCIVSCIQPFDAKTIGFKNILVVDALLTDELKSHKVVLTRLFKFEEENPTEETGALVKILNGQDIEYTFEETEPGTYYSNIEFAAEHGNEYVLKVTTSDGKKYESEVVRTPQKVPISNLISQRLINDEGVEGAGIFLNNASTSKDPTFFRFEYEETYKIIAPKWDPFEFEVVYYVPCTRRQYEVGIKPRIEEQKTCFGSALSSRIIQASTSDLDKNQIKNKEIRFISRNNYIMSHRYSILVRQFSQNVDAHSYYQGLESFSSSDNIFSQIQPGFLEGNMVSISNSTENVLGYFEVASVSEKRTYFNYDDLFPGEPLPPYAINCNTLGNPPLYGPGYHCDGLVCDGDCDSPLIEAILAGLITFAAEKEGDDFSPYFTWPSPCGDCTKLGSNIVPEFWIE